MLAHVCQQPSTISHDSAQAHGTVAMTLRRNDGSGALVDKKQEDLVIKPSCQGVFKA